MSDEIKLPEELESELSRMCGNLKSLWEAAALEEGDPGPPAAATVERLRLAIAKAIRDAGLRMRGACAGLAQHIHMAHVLRQPPDHARASEALRIRDAIRRLEPWGGK